MSETNDNTAILQGMDLAREVVALPGWRWLPGMLNGKDRTRYVGDESWAWSDPYRHHAQGIAGDDWPDLTDPATAGCLLALLGPVWAVVPPGGCQEQWSIALSEEGAVVRGDTLGEASARAAIAMDRWPGGGVR